MRQKLLSLFALLLMAVTGAWAQTTYNVTFSANGNTKTIENVTLPYTFMCDYWNEDGELDGIIRELYGLEGGYCNQGMSVSGSSQVSAGTDDGWNDYITVNGPIDGSATVTGDYDNFEYSLTITTTEYTPPMEIYLEVNSPTSATLKYGLLPAGKAYYRRPPYDPQVSDASNSAWWTGEEDDEEYMDFISQAGTSITVDESCRNFPGGEFINHLFSPFQKTTTINHLENLKTSNALSMEGMFINGRALTSLDLSGWDTSNVTNMSTMFCNCQNLTTIIVGDGWNTSKVSKSGDMFKGCIKLPNYNSGVTDKTKAKAGDGGYLVNGQVTLAETDDNAEWIEANNGKTYNVTLTRTLQTGSYNTFSVPFNAAIPSGWTVKELTGAELNGGTLSLTFADATGIEAGKPYLVKVTSEVVNLTFEDVTVSNTATPTETTAVNFVPTLGKALVTGEGTNASDPKTVLFLGANNTLYNPTVVNDSEQESSYMKGFRAYFQLKGEAAQAPALARAFVMNFGDGEATGIITISADQPATVRDGIYDLQGRKIEGQPTQKGVYIVNGKKVIK